MTGGWLHGSAEFPTLLFLSFSLSPGPAERVRRRVLQSGGWKKKREISSIFRFYSWDFARRTNRCCLSFARQALLRFYRLNRLFILIASARARTRNRQNTKRNESVSTVVYFVPLLLLSLSSLLFSFVSLFPTLSRSSLSGWFCYCTSMFGLFFLFSGGGGGVFRWAAVDVTACTFCQAP